MRRRLIVAVWLGAASLLLQSGAGGHNSIGEGILWNGDGHCMKGRAAVGHTPYVDSRTISLKDSFHVPGMECSDYDAVGRAELKVSPNLGKLRKKGWRKCRDYGTFKNPHNNIEVLRFVANPEDPPCGRGVYRNISWHARYFNGSWKEGVKASPGHFWRANYTLAKTAAISGVLTPESPWWKATRKEARAAQSDNAMLIERLSDGTQKVFLLGP
jgi:hypothetical protein